MKELILWYKTKKEALDSACDLTKEKDESYMVCELPESIAFAVMRTKYFNKMMKKEGVTQQHEGTFTYDR